jgi:predicted nucleic acid-binding protein
MARRVFADTAYWIGLIDNQDQWHESAENLASTLGPVEIFTSQMVLTETLNQLSSVKLRLIATSVIRELMANDLVTVVESHTPEVDWHNALTTYEQYKDKEWSHTDCASYLIMLKHQIGEALTPDHHFEQMRFTALMIPR